MNATASMLGNQDVQTSQLSLAVKFWGVRGSIPIPGATTLGYGGNTVCVEVLADQQRFIFDGGTGLRALGETLCQIPGPVEAHLFFTHTQWDRIQGVPFFWPAFEPRNRFHIYGGTATNGASIKQCLSTQMLQPGCTVPLQTMQASLGFHNVLPGATLSFGQVTIEAIGLSGGRNALGYCLRYGDRTVVYATDTDHEHMDENLLFLAHQADLLICDGTSTCDRTISPNSTPPWQAAVELAQCAQVKQLAMVHYGPRQTDEALDALAATLQNVTPTASLVREGTVIELV